MNLWLDDARPAPPGWVHAKTVEEAKALILRGDVQQLSLDNDLGLGPDGKTLPEGYTLVDWMAENDLWPSEKPRVHSMNPVRAAYMRAVIERYFHVGAVRERGE